MSRLQLLGGVLMLIAAAILFLATDVRVPVAGGLAVVGIALIATSRRRRR